MICPFQVATLNYPNNIAWSTNSAQNGTYTYSQAHEEICKNQLRFRELNISSKNLVAINSENTPRLLAFLFAAHRENIPVIILGSFSTNEGKISAIERSNALEISLDDFYKTTITDDALDSTCTTTLSPTQEAVVLFTSGSTGVEKGVVLTIDNLFESAEASNKCTDLKSDSSWLSSLTLSRIGGLGIAYRTAICGAEMAFTEELSVKGLEKVIKASKITHMSLVPMQLQELMKHDENIPYLKKLTCILLGGAAAPESLLKQIETHTIPVLTTYGMTETSSHISLASLDDPMTRVYSSGKILPHTKIRFRNEKGELGTESNFIGVLEVSVKTLCKRYIDDAGMEKFTEDQWYNTGDIAFLDEHQQLHIIGRNDSMIVSGGENIHLREIEIVAERIEGVDAAAAIPVPHPKWGQRPILYVESSTLTKEQVLSILKVKLNKIKIPDDIIVVDKLPRISIGKIDYQKIKTMFEKK